MNPLVKEVRHNPLLWLLAFVALVFASVYFLTEVPLLLGVVGAYRRWFARMPAPTPTVAAA